MIEIPIQIQIPIQIPIHINFPTFDRLLQNSQSVQRIGLFFCGFSLRESFETNDSSISIIAFIQLFNLLQSCGTKQQQQQQQQQRKQQQKKTAATATTRKNSILIGCQKLVLEGIIDDLPIQKK